MRIESALFEVIAIVREQEYGDDADDGAPAGPAPDIDPGPGAEVQPDLMFR